MGKQEGFRANTEATTHTLQAGVRRVAVRLLATGPDDRDGRCGWEVVSALYHCHNATGEGGIPSYGRG